MSSKATTGVKGSSDRLHFLDGLRGLACFYVLLFHEFTSKLIVPGELHPVLKWLYAGFNFGRLSVVFFIVLSGFSLMLPIARSGKLELTRGLRDFVRRRARRILPPYYVALLLSAAMIVAFNALGSRFGMGKRVDEAALSTGSFISHVLLLHNLNFDWVYRINGPMWSVATEWQIYFVFALGLLPLSRRVGIVTTVFVAWVVGCLPFALLPADGNFFWACPWFLGSFALGMFGAMIAFYPPFASSIWQRVPWALIAWLCFVVFVIAAIWFHCETWPYPVTDLLVSVLAFALINACVQRSSASRGGNSPLLRFLGSRILVYLGGFSYSLYLVQHPLLRLIDKGIERLHLSSDQNAVLELMVITPLMLACAWLFAELFERPFTSGGIILPALSSGKSRPQPQ